MLLQVLEVEQLQGHPRLAPFGVKVAAVRPGARALAGWAGGIEPDLERLVREALDVGPPEAGGAGPPLDPGDGPQPDAQALGHLSVGPAQGPLPAEDLADLTHG